MLVEVGILHYVLGFALGVVCGSVPSGLWIVRAFFGIDIREYGSKNIGTTNVFRTVGSKTAFMVLIADMVKGIIAVAIVHYIFNSPYLDVATALGALLGHNYSVFLGFKGGKGVATGLGILVFLMPKTSGAVLVLWIIIVALTRYVSLASILAAVFTPIASWYFGYPLPYIALCVVAGLNVIVRHKENISRLMNGTEGKIKPGNAKDFKK